jgi:uncharacterized protein (DUF4415 family)
MTDEIAKLTCCFHTVRLGHPHDLDAGVPSCQMEIRKGIRRKLNWIKSGFRESGESRIQIQLVSGREDGGRARARYCQRCSIFSGVPEDWYKRAEAVMPTPKKLLSLRLDSDVVDWFKQQGPGYQTRINAVLRAFVQQAAKRRT